MANIDDIRKLLDTATVAGGTDEASIHEAELKLGVRFSPSYRQFLSCFGAARCSGFELVGLFDAENNDDEPPPWSNVVTATKQIRRASGGLIPNEYIFISDDGGDYKFYLDTSRVNSRGECHLVALGPGVDGVIVADDFFDFVSRSFNGSLSF